MKKNPGPLESVIEQKVCELSTLEANLNLSGGVEAGHARTSDQPGDAGLDERKMGTPLKTETPRACCDASAQFSTERTVEELEESILKAVGKEPFDFSDSDRNSCDSYYSCKRCGRKIDEGKGKTENIIHTDGCTVKLAIELGLSVNMKTWIDKCKNPMVILEEPKK